MRKILKFNFLHFYILSVLVKIVILRVTMSIKRSVMIDREAAEQSKEHSQRGLVEFCRKVASAMDVSEDQPKNEVLLKRIYDLHQVVNSF